MRMSRVQKVVALGALLALAVVGGVVVLQARDTTPDLPAEVRTIVGDPAVALPYEVAIPADLNGCPAATVAAPAPPMTAPDTTRPAATTTVPLGDGTFLLAVCLDMSAADVEKVARGQGETAEDGLELVAAERVSSAFGEGYAVTHRAGRQLVTDTYVARGGWVYAVGFLRPEASPDLHRDLYEAMLASWRWADV